MFKDEVEYSLIDEKATRRSYPTLAFLFSLGGLSLVALFLSFNPDVTEDPSVYELPVGTTDDFEFPLGFFESAEIGEPVGNCEFGDDNIEEVKKEGTYLPVEIDINGAKQDSDDVFWIGFTDDRKTNFRQQVMFKRKYDGPDCWSTWFEHVKRGSEITKDVDIYIHIPHDQTQLQVITMSSCLPTRWSSDGMESVESITLTCVKIVQGGLMKKTHRRSCDMDDPNTDMRDCLHNEDYAAWRAGKPVKKTKKCDEEPCFIPTTGGKIDHPNDCDDPRDCMKNEEFLKAHGLKEQYPWEANKEDQGQEPTIFVRGVHPDAIPHIINAVKSAHEDASVTSNSYHYVTYDGPEH